MKTVNNKLRVCHFPQIPCEPFIVEVKDEFEANLIVETLANQHLWLFDNNFIPDYSNVITVDMFENGEWVDYWNEEELMEFEEFKKTYIDNVQ